MMPWHSCRRISSNTHLINNYHFSKMTQQHPVVPPKYMLDAWIHQYQRYGKSFGDLLVEAVQYGADTELEECCKLFESNSVCGTKFQRRSSVRDLRDRRRPKSRQVSMTVSITGTEEDLQQLIRKLKDDQEISIKFWSHHSWCEHHWTWYQVSK